MYELLMVVCVTLFVGLVAMRVYHAHHAHLAKTRAERLARIRVTVAWLRTNVHLPKFILRRKERQVARTAKWARLAEEKERERALAKRVTRILAPYSNLDTMVREKEKKEGRLIPVYPLTSDKNLVRR